MFDHHHLKIIKETFSFPEIVSTHQKSVYFVDCFLRYTQFWSPETRVALTIFDQAHPIIFESTFNLQESISTRKKSDFFINLFQRYC